MKFCHKILAIAIITSTCAMISCAGPSSFTYQNATLSVQFALVGYAGNFPVNPIGNGGITGGVLPQCSANTTALGCSFGGTVYCNTGAQCTTNAAILMPSGGGAGTCIELYASVTNTALNPTWTIYPSPVSGTSGSSNVGGFNTQGGPTTTTGPVAFYCEPSNPPIYYGAQLAQSQTLGPGGTALPQGTTEVVVTNPIDPNNPANVATANLYFAYQITSGALSSIAVGLWPSPSLVIPLGSTYQFTGWVAGANGYGNPCNVVPAPTSPIAGTAITWEAGAAQGSVVPGGSAQYGTIVATSGTTALYTAPTTYPSSTVHSAVIVAKSTACPTILTGGGTAFETTSTTVTFP